MKYIFFTITILCLLFSISSCKKGSIISNPLLPDSDPISGRVSVTTNNLQTKYGTFASSSSLQGGFTKLNVKSLNVGGYEVKENSVGQFFSQTDFDKTLEQAFASFYGKSLNVNINGNFMPDVPAVPYANVADITNLQNWDISKTTGVNLTWKIYNLKSVPDVTNVNNTGMIPAIEMPVQVSASKTVVALVPDDLQHTTGTSQYWVIEDGSTSFTIPPSALTMYATNEVVSIVIGTGTEISYTYSAGNPVSFLALNTTMLPGLTLTP